MNDKKEPFNAVGDPFFKQVGEEHVEVAEEGQKWQWGQCTWRLYQWGMAESPGTNSGFRREQWGLLGLLVGPDSDAAMSKLQCCYNAAMLLQWRSLRPSQVEVDIFSAMDSRRG